MKNDRLPRGVTGQVVLGVLVIGMGLLFLLDNLGLVDMHRAFSFWPMLFVIVGTVKLCDTRSQGGTLLGAALVGVGILMMLDRLDIINFSVRTLWPLILIGLGGFLVAKALRSRSMPGTPGAGMLDDTGSGETVDITAILGGYERRVATQDFRGGEITAVMGGCELDMRSASIRGEAVINVFAFWGGVTIKCPPDWTVILLGTPILGAIMGGVEIRN
jgi:predicted membrane protein